MNTEKLIKKIDSLVDLIPHNDKKNLSVSNVSVAWHLEHILLVVNNISKSIIHSNPTNYKKEFNFYKTIIFSLGYIPRGKGKAPQSVAPKLEYTSAEFLKEIAKAKEHIVNFKNLKTNNFFVHPKFKMLNLKDTITFLTIHTNHHLKIIDDIVKKSK